MSSETKPTVLFVVTPAQMGGSNRSVVDLLRSLDGQVQRVLASPSFGEMRKIATKEGLAEEFVDLPRRPGSPLDRLMRVLGGFKLGWWAFRRRQGLTAIHANALTGLNLSVPAALASRRNIVVWIHDPVGSKWGNRLGPVVKRLLPRLRIAAVSRVAEQVAVDNGLCQAGEAQLIPNPIDPDDIVAAKKSRTPGRIVVGVLGGSSHRKGFDLLPETIGLVASSSVLWKLFVTSGVSQGMEAAWDELRAFPEDKVEINRKVSDVSTVYAQMDIVFCPSRNESFCRVAAEAMINGIPVVGNDIEPLRDLLGDEEAGIIYPNGDTGAAAAALTRLVDDEVLRARLGAEGKARSHRFRPDQVAGQLMGLYLSEAPESAAR